MNGGDAPFDVSLRMTADQASEFVERVTTDDDFRAQLEQNPGQVLEEYGIQATPGLIPDDVALPSKEELEAVQWLFEWVLRFRADPTQVKVHHTFFFAIFAIAKIRASGE